MNPTALRHRLALACALAVAPACGEVDAPGGTGSSTPSESSPIGDETDDPTDTGSTQGLGTQVGSEGFWGCIITDIEEVDAKVLVPGTSQSAAKEVAALAGSWTLSLDIVGRGTEVGELWVDTPTRYALVTTDGDCGSYIEARTTGLLDRGDTSVVVDGSMAFAMDASAVLLAAPSSDADVREAWGDPSTADLAQLVVDAELDADTLVGAVSHAECLEVDCATKDLALLAGTR